MPYSTRSLGLMGLALITAVACAAKEDMAADSGAGAGEDDTGNGGESGVFTAGAGDSPGDGQGMTSNGEDAPADDAPVDDDDDDTGGFIAPPDGGVAGQCDPTSQDCPDGEKCSAWATVEGEPWNANRCVPLMGSGQVGDACNIEGGKYTGEDDCDLGLICLLTDDDGLDGACIEFCTGSMTCPSGGSCSVYNGGSLPICLTTCDPLIQDCPDGQGCYASSGTGEFICFKYSGENGEGMPGDPCNYLNQCQPGTACLTAASVEGCGAEASCCAPFCDLSDADPDMNCNAAEMCTAFFADPPPDYVDVGVCALPE